MLATLNVQNRELLALSNVLQGGLIFETNTRPVIPVVFLNLLRNSFVVAGIDNANRVVKEYCQFLVHFSRLMYVVETITENTNRVVDSTFQSSVVFFFRLLFGVIIT